MVSMLSFFLSIFLQLAGATALVLVMFHYLGNASNFFKFIAALSLFSYGVILAGEAIGFLSQYPHSTAKLIVDIIFMIILPITPILMLKWIKTHFKIERIK